MSAKKNGLNGKKSQSKTKKSKKDDADNIVQIPTLAERDKMRKKAKKEAKKALSKAEPMFRLPIATKSLIGILLSVFVLTHVFLPEELYIWTIHHFGFTPGAFTGAQEFYSMAILTPFTHLFFHASLLHLSMNGVMLLAFGSGLEKWLGPKKMIAFFITCGLLGALLHFALFPQSLTPVIGASGGLSGLFAAALIMINQGQSLQGQMGPQALRTRVLPFALLWIGITLIFGLMGGGSVAWAAHLGGFLGGFLVLKAMRVF